METDILVQRLVAEATPVRRRGSPARLVLTWLAIGLPFVVATAIWQGFDRDLRALAADPRFLSEECAALATAVAAALAAFASGTPGFSRLYRYLPLPALAVWIAMIGAGCVASLTRVGGSWFSLGIDTGCLPAMAASGIIPAAAMLLLVRGSVPLTPNLTTFYAALAPAALVSFSLQLFHAGDLTPTALVWHFGLAWLVAPLLASLGRWLLVWPRPA